MKRKTHPKTHGRRIGVTAAGRRPSRQGALAHRPDIVPPRQPGGIGPAGMPGYESRGKQRPDRVPWDIASES